MMIMMLNAEFEHTHTHTERRKMTRTALGVRALNDLKWFQNIRYDRAALRSACFFLVN